MSQAMSLVMVVLHLPPILVSVLVLIGTQTPALILAETARLEAHTAGRDAARLASTLAIAHTKAAVEAAGPPPPIEETVPMSAWFNAPALRIGLEYSSSIP